MSCAHLAASGASTCCSSAVMSGLTKIPPLNPAIGVRRSKGAINISIPRGGRPLVIANPMPDARSDSTAFTARAVSTFSAVTSVPSTSDRTSEIFSRRPSFIIHVPLLGRCHQRRQTVRYLERNARSRGRNRPRHFCPPLHLPHVAQQGLHYPSQC